MFIAEYQGLAASLSQLGQTHPLKSQKENDNNSGLRTALVSILDCDKIGIKRGAAIVMSDLK